MGVYALPGAVHGQPPPQGGDPVGVLQDLFRLGRGSSLPKSLGRNLYRPHPGKGAPGQVMAQKGGPGIVEGLLQCALDGVVDRYGLLVQLFTGEADHPVMPAVSPKDQGAHVGQLFPPVEGKNDGVIFPHKACGRRRFGILRPLGGKEGQHHLLGGVVIAPGIPVHIVRGQPNSDDPHLPSYIRSFVSL